MTIGYFSSHIDLKCLLCVCVTVKNLTIPVLMSTYEYSSYSPSARSLCSIACFGPPHSEFLDPPLYRSS